MNTFESSSPSDIVYLLTTIPFITFLTSQRSGSHMELCNTNHNNSRFHQVLPRLIYRQTKLFFNLYIGDNILIELKQSKENFHPLEGIRKVKILIKIIVAFGFLAITAFSNWKRKQSPTFSLNLPIKYITQSRFFSMEAPIQREILGYSRIGGSKESLACGSFWLFSPCCRNEKTLTLCCDGQETEGRQ